MVIFLSVVKSNELEVSLWHSGLRIWLYHCNGQGHCGHTGLILGPGNVHIPGIQQKCKKKKKTKKNKKKHNKLVNTCKGLKECLAHDKHWTNISYITYYDEAQWFSTFFISEVGYFPPKIFMQLELYIVKTRATTTIMLKWYK